MKVSTLYTTISLTAALLLAPSALAQDDEGVLFDSDIAVSSNIMERGRAKTTKDYGVSGSFSLTKGNVYGGVFVSNIAAPGYSGELELFAGVTKPLGGWDLTFSGKLDILRGKDYRLAGVPVVSDNKYFPEVKATLARDYGLAYIVAGSSWSMDGRWDTPSDSVYTFLEAELPIPRMPELTLITHLGQDFRKNNVDAFDWSVGLSVFVKQFEITTSYVRTTHPLNYIGLPNRGKGRFVTGLKVYF